MYYPVVKVMENILLDETHKLAFLHVPSWPC